MKKTTWRYTLCGSLTGVIPAAVLLAVFGTVTVLLRKANNDAFFVTGTLMLFVLAVIGYAFWQHCFHRLCLADDRLFLQTTPANGKEYAFDEIRAAWQTTDRTPNGVLQHCFHFETTDGGKHRFTFEGSDEEGVLFALSRLPAPPEETEG